MTRTLLIIVAVGALVCVVSFTTLGAVGGFKGRHFHPGHFHFDGDSDGAEVTRDLPWTGGESLHISVPASITYTQGPQVRFTVSGPKSVIDSLHLDDGSLGRTGGMGWGHSGDLNITVTSPNTHDFHLSGAQDLTLKQYDQDSLELHMSGAGDVEGEGHAKRLEAHISGAGDLDLKKLPVDDAVVSISGAGDATLDPKVSADIDISGAGHVTLKTKPPTLHQHIAGFGAVDLP